MVHPRKKRISRYLLRESDRSGFYYVRNQMVKDEGLLVGSDEFDTPPPAKKPIGAEGDLSPGFTRAAYQSYTNSTIGYSIQYLAAGSGITFQTGTDQSNDANWNFQWLFVTGSNQAVTPTVNPRITAGFQNAQVTIQCIDSAITLQDGNGLDMVTPFTMTSGDVITFFYSETDSLWHETSRGNQYSL